MLISCGLAQSQGPSDEAGVSGLVLDAQTREPIAGAWIFEATPAGTRGADIRRFSQVRETRSDEAGIFRFSVPAPGQNDFFGGRSKTTPRYHVYHESYGLIWGREARGGNVLFELRLRDSHLRQRDAAMLCEPSGERRGQRRERTDAPNDLLRTRVRALACAPADPKKFSNGAQRARGEYDEQGRRTGRWTFYRRDGSVIARGNYSAGAATGDWAFHPENGAVSP